MGETTDGRAFPATAWSAIAGPGMTAEERRRRMGRLIELYWKPVFSVLRRFYSRQNDDARDLTQSFFAHILRNEVVERYDVALGRFRTYLKTCLRKYLAQYPERRMPTVTEVAIQGLAQYDPPAPEPAGDDPPEAAFDREWVETLYARAMAELKRILVEGGRERTWRAFELYDLPASRGEEPPTYAEVATQVGTTEHAIRRDLRNARALLRDLIKHDVRETVADMDQLADELRFIFGRSQ